jgi:pimeloyl-ACP methyl ester carboxylesterase
MNATTDALMARYPARAVETSAGVITLREAGEGEPCVLLHGVGSSSGSWIPFLDTFRGYRLYAWDAPGYGGSAPLAMPAPRAADYARSLNALLDALGITKFRLVGHSLGALIAGAFAATQGARVTQLALLDPAAGYGLSSAEARQKMLDGRMKMLYELGPERMAAERGAALVSPEASEQAIEFVRWSMRNIHIEGYAQAVRMLAEGRLIEDAAQYAGPVRVMCGTKDTVTPEEGCRQVAAAFAHGTYRSLPGLGHASYVESPPLVDGELSSFFSEVKA